MPEQNETAPGLAERIADAVQPLLMDTLPKPIAAARAQEVADAVLAVVQPVIDEVDLLRRGAAERADLLEEARDALSAAGQNGAHGDDWPNIAPSIRALGERASNAEAALAQLREGEEPYEDERIVPTPAQWIWNWNRATPEQRLDVVAYIKALSERLDRVEAVARDWAEAQPLLPGQALADLINALSDDPQPVMCHTVRVGERYIRVHGDRVPTPDELVAIGALLDANDTALTPPADDYQTTTGHETTCTAGFDDTCTCTDGGEQQ